MKKIKVSVIVPIYNSEKYLVKCLESLVKQTLKEVEIILIDDGSTDKSEQICLTYANKYKQIKYFKKENNGQASARNLGITKANGEYLSFVDSDDYIKLDMLEKAYNKGISDNTDIVIFNKIQVENNKEENKISYYNKSDDINKNYILSDPCPWNKIFKRDLFVSNNIKFLEGKIYEDLAAIPTIICYTSSISYLPEFLYYYVIHEDSTMRQKNYNKKLEDIFEALDYLKTQFILNKVYDKYKEEIEYNFIEHLLHGASLRFIKYPEGDKDLKLIRKIFKEQYPNYYKNKYFKLESWKYKLFCNLVYYNQISIVKKIIRSR